MTDTIDTNHDTTNRLLALKALGITKIIRYINPLGTRGEKTVKPAEARAIAAAGMVLGLVCEGWGGTDRGHASIMAAAGARDGAFCAAYAETVGAPPGALISYAIDTDLSDSEIRAYALPYLSNVNARDGDKYGIAVYGSGATCLAALNSQLVKGTWVTCSTGWNGSKAFLKSGRHNIQQLLPKTLAGIDTDPDIVNPLIPDPGFFFTPFSTVSHPVIVAAVNNGTYTEDGKASWYDEPQGMANGKPLDITVRTLAHRTLPFGTVVKVTRTANGKSSIGVVTDRGPYVKGRIVDLTPPMARDLDMIDIGVASVHIETIAAN